MIGKRWLTIKDRKRRRRLDSADDLVRAEIRAALQQKIPVIPVTVQNAAMPQTEDLPDDIRLLARRNGIQLRRHPLAHRCRAVDQGAGSGDEALKRLLERLRGLRATRRQKVPRTSRCRVPARGPVPFSHGQRVASQRPLVPTRLPLPRVPLGSGSVRSLPARGTRFDQRQLENRPPSKATLWLSHRGAELPQKTSAEGWFVHSAPEGRWAECHEPITYEPSPAAAAPWSEGEGGLRSYGDCRTTPAITTSAISIGDLLRDQRLIFPSTATSIGGFPGPTPRTNSSTV